MKVNVSKRAWINTAFIAALVVVWTIDMLRDTDQEEAMSALEQRVATLERALELR